MNSQDDYSEGPGSKRALRGGSGIFANRLFSVLLIGLGVLAFELTADPALSVSIACLKLGVEDLLTAVWIWRTDPDRARGRACSMFQAALAFAKIGLGSFFMMVLIGIVFLSLDPNGPGGAARLLRVMASTAGRWSAFVPLYILATFLAIGFALAGRVRVWVGREARRARVLNVWPPSSPQVVWKPGRNRASGLIRFALVISAISTSMLGLKLPPPARVGFTWAHFWLLAVFYGSIIAAVCFARYLDGAIVAWSPWECFRDRFEAPRPSGDPSRFSKRSSNDPWQS